MELNKVFINIGDKIQNYFGGGGYTIPDCRVLRNLHATVTNINYEKREISIRYKCEYEDVEKTNHYIIKYYDQPEWKKMDIIYNI